MRCQAKKSWIPKLRALVGEHDHGLSPAGVTQCQQLRTAISQVRGWGYGEGAASTKRAVWR
jgi:hypothetical protein